MASPSPWSIKGISPEARKAAKEAAQKSGMTLGAWLTQNIAEASGSESLSPSMAPRAVAQAKKSASSQGIDDVLSAISQLSQQLLADRGGAIPAGAARQIGLASEDEVSVLHETLQTTQAQLDELKEQTADLRRMADSSQRHAALAVRAAAKLTEDLATAQTKAALTSDAGDGDDAPAGMSAAEIERALSMISSRIETRCDAADARLKHLDQTLRTLTTESTPSIATLPPLETKAAPVIVGAAPEETTPEETVAEETAPENDISQHDAAQHPAAQHDAEPDDAEPDMPPMFGPEKPAPSPAASDSAEAHAAPPEPDLGTQMDGEADELDDTQRNILPLPDLALDVAPISAPELRDRLRREMREAQGAMDEGPSLASSLAKIKGLFPGARAELEADQTDGATVDTQPGADDVEIANQEIANRDAPIVDVEETAPDARATSDESEGAQEDGDDADETPDGAAVGVPASPSSDSPENNVEPASQGESQNMSVAGGEMFGPPFPAAPQDIESRPPPPRDANVRPEPSPEEDEAAFEHEWSNSSWAELKNHDAEATQQAAPARAQSPSSDTEASQPVLELDERFAEQPKARANEPAADASTAEDGEPLGVLGGVDLPETAETVKREDTKRSFVGGFTRLRREASAPRAPSRVVSDLESPPQFIEVDAFEQSQTGGVLILTVIAVVVISATAIGASIAP